MGFYHPPPKLSEKGGGEQPRKLAIGEKKQNFKKIKKKKTFLRVFLKLGVPPILTFSFRSRGPWREKHGLMDPRLKKKKKCFFSPALEPLFIGNFFGVGGKKPPLGGGGGQGGFAGVCEGEIKKKKFSPFWAQRGNPNLNGN